MDYVAKTYGVQHVAIGTDVAYVSRNDAAERAKIRSRSRPRWESLWPPGSRDAAGYGQPHQQQSLAWTNWPLFTVGLVQRGYSELEGATSLSPAEARRRIRAGAQRACEDVREGAIEPLRLAPPYEWEVRYLEGQEAGLERFLRRPGAERIDSRTAVLRTADQRAVFGP